MKSLPSPVLRRAGALVIATAITSTTLLSTAAPAQAHPAGDRAVSAGATWLTAPLTDGILNNEEYDYHDLGLSADIALALDAVGGNDATVAEVVDAIEPDVESWVTAGTPERVYAGSVAKMVSVVQAAGQDPTTYNGTDQVARLEGLVSSSAPLTGRLEDTGVDPNSPYDADFVAVIGQSFAVRALTMAGSDRAAASTSFLLDQQCDEGFFRGSLTADKTSTEQGCVSGVDSGNIDATALTVINILDTPGASAAAKGAALLAASWLKTQQEAAGSFGAGSLGTTANTTGLAGWARAVAGYDAAATKAASWLRGLQVADLAPCTTTLSANNGAVLLKAEEVPVVREAGTLDVPTRERARRATAQALPALANVPAGDAVTLLAPATAAEKSAVSVTVAGLGAGEPACVSLGGQVRQLTGTGSPVTVTFTLSAGVATHTFSVTTLGGTTTATTSATATQTPTLAPVPQVGDLRTRRVVAVKRNRFAVRVACDAEVACTGMLEVRTARKVEVRSGKRVVELADRAYTVAPGEEKRLVLRLTRVGRAVLADGRVKVRTVQKAPDAERAVTTFWLKPSKG